MERGAFPGGLIEDAFLHEMNLVKDLTEWQEELMARWPEELSFMPDAEEGDPPRFADRPADRYRVGSATRRTDNQTHSGILQHYLPLLVRHLTLTSPLYRRLKENGILTIDQIGLLELEESPERRISKLIEVLRSADHHVFTTFCAILHEMGYHHLAQILQKASTDRQVLPPVPSFPQPKQSLNEVILHHHGNNKAIKEENIKMKQNIQGMRTKYAANLQELEERISLAKWERDLAIKERNIIWSENEALQTLNTELQALIHKLRDTTLQSNIRDLGFSLESTEGKSRRLYAGTHLGLIYR
ncbi:uncharacterized protein WCC33_004991 [Rhinophrynus dorsalis]